VVEATAIQLHQAGAAHPERLDPDSWADDAFALSDPERRIMTDLQLDIPANLSAYPAWQDYIRTRKPKTLVVWGQTDFRRNRRGNGEDAEFRPVMPRL
jgi:hypothetical protein